MAESLYVISNRPSADFLQLLGADKQAGLLLLARGLLIEPSVLEGREVYCLAEEVQELGLEGKLPAAVKPLPAREVISLFAQRNVLSLD